MRGAPGLGPSQHRLDPASSQPAPPADVQACREGKRAEMGGGHISTTEGPSSDTWRADMCSVPKAMGQDGQLEPSIWKKAGGTFGRVHPSMGKGHVRGNKAVAPLPKRVSRSGVTQLTPRTSPGQRKGPSNVWSGERELEGR